MSYVAMWHCSICSVECIIIMRICVGTINNVLYIIFYLCVWSDCMVVVTKTHDIMSSIITYLHYLLHLPWYKMNKFNERYILS